MAQEIAFEKRIPVPKDFIAFDVEQASDGGYYMAGKAFRVQSLGTEALVIKADRQGNMLWHNLYNFDPSEDWSDIFSAVSTTSDGGAIFAGSTERNLVRRSESGWARVGDVLLLKLNAEGGREWMKALERADNEYASAVQQTADGGYIIAGSSSDPEQNNPFRAYLAKTDASGTQQWSRTLPGNEANSVRETSDGGYIIAGCDCSDPMGENYQALLIKTNANGNVAWSRSITKGIAYSAEPTSDGGYIVSGEEWNGYMGFVAKYDGNGNEEWLHVLESGQARAARQTADGGYLAVSEDRHFIFSKLDSSGSKERTLATTQEGARAYLTGGAVTADGGLAAVGWYIAGGLFLAKASIESCLVVDAVSDEPDADPSDGICATADGDCTLRAAIEESNAQPGRQCISFAIDTSSP